MLNEDCQLFLLPDGRMMIVWTRNFLLREAFNALEKKYNGEQDTALLEQDKQKKKEAFMRNLEIFLRHMLDDAALFPESAALQQLRMKGWQI